jgi:hypothetical protein
VGDRPPPDPTFDWPSVCKSGDVVRLDDGRIAVVAMIMDYATELPARWELVVRTTGAFGDLDDAATEPWLCRPAPEEKAAAQDLGLA